MPYKNHKKEKEIMATAQGQDIIRCSLCQDPVEFHCNFCNTDLCSNCVLIHMKDKTKKHQVVEFSNRKSSFILPDCNSHENKCETYCCDCKIPICIKCVTDSHKGHDFLDIENLIENRKKQIIADIEEEKNICDRYQKLKEAILSQETECDNAISKISQKEEDVVKYVRESAEKLRADVVKKKTEIMTLNTENVSKILDAEKQLQQVIKESEETLQSRFANDVLNYISVKEKFQKDPCSNENLSPVFSPALPDEGHILEILGSLSYKDANRGGKLEDLSNDNPSILTTIQSPYTPLFQIQCGHNGNLWTSAVDNTLKEIDNSGNILRTIRNVDNPARFTINEHGDLLFIALRPSATINMFREAKFKRYLSFEGWFLTGLCFSRNGHVLVSMRSACEKQSRVTRFSKQIEVQQIQYDGQGSPLFSTYNRGILSLTENRNGDICAADLAGKAVVVVDASGELRFKYKGNITNVSKYKEFIPLHIAADVNYQILISDDANDILHIIDSDGNFVRYIEYPCKGGLSIDTDHNLVVGDELNGLIRIIKY